MKCEITLHVAQTVNTEQLLLRCAIPVVRLKYMVR